MAQQDDRLAALCVLCRGAPGTREHAVPRIFLDAGVEESPTVQTCRACNNEASLDEQYVACIIDVALCGGTNDTFRLREKVRKSLNHSPKLKYLIDGNRREHGDQTAYVIDTKRFDRVFLKMARCLAFYENHEYDTTAPLLTTYRVLPALSPGATDNFLNLESSSLLPDIGSRALMRTVNQVSMKKSSVAAHVIVQVGRFSYAIGEDGHHNFVLRIVVSDFLMVEVGS